MSPLRIAQKKDNCYRDTTLVLETQFVDVASNPVDPTTVTLTVTDPDGTITTLTDAGGDFTKPTVGTFQYSQKFTIAGRWYYSWLGDSPGSSASERQNGYVQVAAATR